MQFESDFIEIDLDANRNIVFVWVVYKTLQIL
jgi:hypothetical protein